MQKQDFMFTKKIDCFTVSIKIIPYKFPLITILIFENIRIFIFI